MCGFLTRIFLAIAMFALLCLSASAATIRVATSGSNTTGNGSFLAPFATIQKAVDTALNGDVVLVAAGTYSGAGNRDINLLGKVITVKSSSGPSQTILDLGRNKGFSATSSEPMPSRMPT